MEFTDEELSILVKWYLLSHQFADKDISLSNRLSDELAQREELASIDFNVCEGGACTL